MVTKPAIPVTGPELAELMADPKRLAELSKEPDGLKTLIENYATEFYKRDPDVKGQLKEQMVGALKEFYEEHEIKLPADVLKRLPLDPTASGDNPTDWRKWAKLNPMDPGMRLDAGFLNPRDIGRKIAATGHGLGTKLDGQFKDLAEYVLTIWQDQKGIKAAPEILKAFNENAGVDGGFLVPEEFRAELFRVALEMAVVRPRARVIPMGSQTLTYPAIRDTSHATNVFGGVQGSWLAEAATLSTVRTPAFQQIRLQAKKLTSYTVASNELLADSAISMESLINDLFPQALAYFEDDAFINGTGAGQPLGLLNADALVAIAKETGQSATTFVYENAVKMYARMLPSSINRAVWVTHPDVFPQLAVMALNIGTGGSAVFMPSAVGGPPMSLFGRPIIFSEKAQTLGTAGDVYFVDWGYYLIGDRQQLQMAVSPHINFATDEMAWRFTQRVDGRPWITSAITPRNGSNTMTPFLDTAVRS